MASQTWTITSLFTPKPKPIVGRKDSGISDVTAQLNQFKGFGDNTEEQVYARSYYSQRDDTDINYSISATPTTTPVTIVFTPSTGSTCLSLYPRTKTFSYLSSLTTTSCLAKCSDGETWRITQVSSEAFEGASVEELRFTFEHLPSEEADAAPLAVYKNCAVKPGYITRRGTSADFGRRLSVGHFSSGLSGFMLPISAE
jgi:hypothetical protein